MEGKRETTSRIKTASLWGKPKKNKVTPWRARAKEDMNPILGTPGWAQREERSGEGEKSKGRGAKTPL